MTNTLFVIRRELSDYFATPVAYVFIVIFLALLGALTFFMGSFFARGQADLSAFFQFHAWVYMLLIPAISMRMWAEELQCMVYVTAAGPKPHQTPSRLFLRLKTRPAG